MFCQVFSEPVPFLGHEWLLSNFPCICSCFWMSQSWASSSQKEKKRKKKGEKDTFPWKSLQLEGKGIPTVRGRAAIMATLLFICTSVIRSSNQWSKHWKPVFGDRVLFAYPGSCKLCGSCSRKMCIAACPGAGAEGWQLLLYEDLKLKLTPIYISSLLLEVASLH